MPLAHYHSWIRANDIHLPIFFYTSHISSLDLAVFHYLDHATNLRSNFRLQTQIFIYLKAYSEIKFTRKAQKFN